MRIEWIVHDVKTMQCDAIICPVSAFFNSVGPFSSDILGIDGSQPSSFNDAVYDLRANATVAAGQAFPIAGCAAVKAKYVVLATVPTVSSKYKVTRSAEACLFSSYLNALKAAEENSCEHVCLPPLSIEGCNFTEEHSILCCVYSILSFFLTQPNSKILRVSIVFPCIQGLMQFATFMPSGDALELHDLFSVATQRDRLFDVYRPTLKSFVVFDYKGIPFGSFVKKYSNNHEQRSIIGSIQSLLGDASSSSQSRQEFMKEYMRKKRENSEFRQKENSQRKERRSDSKVKERENSARKSRRSDPTIRSLENAERSAKRCDPAVRAKETSLRKRRRESPSVRRSENAASCERYRKNPFLRMKRELWNRSRRDRFEQQQQQHPEQPERYAGKLRRRARRRLFSSVPFAASSQQSSTLHIERQFKSMVERAQADVYARHSTMVRRSLSLVFQPAKRPRLVDSNDEECVFKMRDEQRARKAAFLRSLCRPKGYKAKALFDAMTGESLRNVEIASTKEETKTLLKVIVAQLVPRPRNVLTKEFIDSIVEDTRTVYEKGKLIMLSLQTKLRKEQHGLEKALNHKDSTLTLEQVIGGLRLHVKSHDKDICKPYKPIEDVFQTPGVFPGLYPSLEKSQLPLDEALSDAQVEDIIAAVESCEEPDVEIKGLLDELLDRVSGESLFAGNGEPLNTTKGVTFVKLCDSSCVIPLFDWASSISDRMTGLCNKNKKASLILHELSQLCFCEKCQRHACDDLEFCKDLKRLLAVLAPHCQNIRTIIRRFYEIKRLSFWIYQWERAVTDADLGQMFELVHQRSSVELQSSEILINYQSEAYVNQHFSKLMARCRERFRNHEIFPCRSCTMLHSKDKIRRISSSSKEAAPIVKDMENPPDEIMLCIECYTYLKKDEIPLLFTGNGLQIPFLPPELSDLNWLEQILIRRVRPIMSTFLLAPMRGRSANKIKGFKGSVLHLNMETEKTINHVIKHLPSAEGLDIIVNTAPKDVVKKLLTVDMEKVIRALLWLRDNNELYKDIEIDAGYDPVNELIDRTLPGDPNLEQSWNSQEADNSDEDVPLQRLRLNPAVRQTNGEGHLLTLEPLEHVALTTIDPPTDEVLPSEKLFAMKDMEGPPVSTLEKNLDLRVFPELYTTGKFGMHHPRAKPVSEVKFLRRNLRSSDSRFRRNLTYLFWSANRQDIKTIMGSASIMVKKMAGGTSIFQRIQEKDSTVDDILSTMFTQVRSHQEYWNNVKRELRNSILYFSVPTFFVTLNPAEYEWPELKEYYNKLYANKTMTVSEFVAMDPVVFARHFSRRVRAVIAEIIYRKDGILGDVHHLFWRLEYQRRGAPHVHMLIWVKGAPQIGRDDPDVVANFIDKHISCAKRDPETEPLLAELVNKFQIHRQPCSATCAMVHRFGKKKVTTCRFMFPIEASHQTVVLTEEERRELSGNLRMKKGYLLKRSEDEKFINAYNVGLLIIWNGNGDIQLVSNRSLKYTDYIASYVGKGESKGVIDGIDLARSKCSVKDLAQFAIMGMKNREMGAVEAADRDLGHPLHFSDMDTIWVPTNSKAERIRRLKTAKEKAATEEGGSETADNLVDVYYPNRSPFLNGFSLFNIAMNYRFVNTLPARSKICNIPIHEIDVQSSNLLEADGWNTRDMRSPFYQHPPGLAFAIHGTKKFMVSRTKPVLPRMYWPNAEEGPAEQEDWCRRVLMAFQAWTDEDLLQGDCDCFLDAYNKFMDSAPDELKSQISRYLDANDDLRAALLQKKKDYEELAKLREELGITDSEALEIQEIVTTPEEVADGEKRLNAGQKDVYETVMAAVRSEDDFKRGNKAEHKPLRMFVSGVGGTGKTALIRQLAAKISLDYSIPGRNKEEPAVLLAAPTGLAALAIKGNTLHSLLQLGVDQGSNSKYQKLSPMKQGELAVLFRNCRLLIVDEASMVANTMLFKVCLRLSEVKINQPFGGINILLFGDLLQLPPVRARDVFHRLSTREVRQTFHSVAMNYSLWELFDYRELTENMRQRSDQEYAELLGRIRIGSPTEDDIKTLLKRMITFENDSGTLKENHAPRKATIDEAAQFYVEKWNSGEEVIALFSKVDDVDNFNKKVQELLQLDVEEICATDVLQKRSVRKEGATVRPYQKIGFRRQDWGKSSSRIEQLLKKNKRKELVEGFQAGLPDRLKIAVKSRVMLRRNINVGAGLVNGAMGMVTQLIRDRKKRVVTVMVKFDNIDDPVAIEQVSAKFELGGELNGTRTQFPLLVAYAVTIHKSQGMTAKNVIANLDDAFATGMVYVALSRATSLAGIFLIGFNPKKIKACEPALTQYKELRRTIGMESLAEGNIQPATKINFHGDRRRRTKRLLVNVRSVSKERTPYHRGQEDARTSDSSPEIVRKSKRSRAKKNVVLEEEQEILNSDDMSNFQPDVYKNASMSALITNSDEFPWLANSGSDCFVNSIVWSIESTNMGVSISNGDPYNPICTFFTTISVNDEGLRHSTRPLRELFPAFLESSQHRQYDAADFYGKLVEALPDRLANQMCVQRKLYVECEVCREETVELLSRDHTIAPVYSAKFEGISQQLQELVLHEQLNRECSRCGIETLHGRWISYDAFDTRVIVLDFPWASDPSAHVRERPEEVLLFGERWHLKAAVEYHSGSKIGRAGHYVARVKKEQDWYTLDDQKTCEEQENFPQNHSQIRMLFFEKI